MQVLCKLFAAATLLVIPACDRDANVTEPVNQPGGGTDPNGVRPYQGVRDTAEDMSTTPNDAGRNTTTTPSTN
jgi:hypothetical protein